MKAIKIFFISIMLIICSVVFVSARPTNVIQGKNAPIFKAIDFNDKTFDLNDSYGKKPIVITFFSVRCVSCLTVVSILEKFKHQKKITNEVEFLYVSLDDWKKEPHIPPVWKEVFKEEKQMRINDGKREIGKLYEVDILPVTIIIDKTGKIIYRRDDYNLDFDSEITKELNSLLPK